jgi:hypothetical protein
VRFKFRKAGTTKKYDFEGIVNGITERFGEQQYLITEWSSKSPIKVRRIEKPHN